MVRSKQRCTDSVQCRLPDSILGPPKVTSVFFFGGDISRYLATKKGGVATDFFFVAKRKRRGRGGICSVILFCGEFSPFCEKYF